MLATAKMPYNSASSTPETAAWDRADDKNCLGRVPAPQPSPSRLSKMLPQTWE